jgi:hypothetical protein
MYEAQNIFFAFCIFTLAVVRGRFFSSSSYESYPCPAVLRGFALCLFILQEIPLFDQLIKIHIAEITGVQYEEEIRYKMYEKWTN